MKKISLILLLFVAAIMAYAMPSPTLKVRFNQPQDIAIGNETIKLDGQFTPDHFWIYGEKGLSIPAEKLLGEQGTILFTFKIEDFKEPKMVARYLLWLATNGRLAMTLYSLPGEPKKLFFGMTDGGDVQYYYTFPEPLKFNQIYCAAIAYDGQKLRLFLNGVLVDESKQQAPMKPVRGLHVGPFKNGFHDPAPWGNDSMAGELTVFDQALTNEEISRLSGAEIQSAAKTFPQQLTIGKTAEKPLIDGDLKDAVWTRAGSMPGLVNGQKMEKSWEFLPNYFQLAYDDENLYLGFSTLFNNRTELKTGLPRTDKEPEVWGDESFEFYLENNGKLYRFGGNVAGGFCEGIGNDGTVNFPWNYASTLKIRIDDRWTWQGEAAIPWKSIGFDKAPDKPIKFNFCRSWFLSDLSTYSSLSANGSYAELDQLPELILADAAPSMRLLQRNNPSDGMLEQTIRFFSPRNELVTYEILLTGADGTIRSIPLAKSEIKLKANVATEEKINVKIPAGAFDTLVFRLLAGDKIIMQQIVPFHLSEEFIKIKPLLFSGKIIAEPQMEMLKSKFGANFTGKLRLLSPDGQKLAETSISDDKAREIAFQMDWPKGAYLLELTDDANGQNVFKHAIFYPGLGEWHKLQFDNRIIPPFTALETSQQSSKLDVSMYGRTYQWDKSLLPTQITSLGTPLLAAPAVLEINGKQVAATEFKNGMSQAHRAEFAAQADSPQYQVSEKSWIEYDGVQYNQLTVKAEKDLNNIIIKLPLNSAEVNFLHTSRDYSWGNRITEKITSPYKRAMSYFPSVWVGSYDKGLGFFAESNRTWKGSEGDCMVLEKNGDKAVLTIRIANELKAGETLDFEFGLIATPVKPLPGNYPLNTFADYHQSWMNRPGKTPTAYSMLSFGGSSDLGGYFCDTPSPEKSINLGEARRTTDAIHTGTGRAMPYNLSRFLTMEYPEVAAFEEEWRMVPGLKLEYMRDGKKYFLTELCPETEAMNFYLWKIREYIKTIPVEGWYFDFSIVPVCNNELHGCQKRTPLLALRDFYRKVMLTLLDAGIEDPIIVLHNTDSIQLPAFTFGTHLFNGEQIRQHSSTLMHNGKDILDTYEPVMFASELSSLPFGLTNSVYQSNDVLMTEFGGDPNEDPELYKFRITKAMLSGALVHNTMVSPSRCHFGIFDKIIRAYDRFDVPKAKFIGYWDNPAKVVKGKDVYVSIYKHKSEAKALAVISHIGKEHITQDVEIEFDPAKLGFDKISQATELMTAEDPDYQELYKLKEQSGIEGGPRHQQERTPLKLGDFGVKIDSIDGNKLKMSLKYHSFGIVELK